MPKKYVSSLKQKSEHHHWILHIRIRLGTKFQLKLTILNFFDQICPKREFPVENRKIALVHASMVITYHIKLFHMGADRHNGILMSLLLLVAETIIERLVGVRVCFLTTIQTNILFIYPMKTQKQRSIDVLIKSCSEKMQQIYRRTPMPKCDFNKVAQQFYWNHASAWLFSCKFTAYFQNTFS